MKLRVYTETYFDAAHTIVGHKGKCAHLHGHTWKVCVWVKGDDTQLDKQGILWDFGLLKEACALFDHHNINQVLPNNPTAEHLALFLYNKFKNNRNDLCFVVRVYESQTPKVSWCECGDNDEIPNR